MKHSIVYSVLDFFRSNTPLNAQDTIFVSQAVFLWLKLSSEQKLEDDQIYDGKDEITDRFELFLYKMCDGYDHRMRDPFKIDDEGFYLIVEKVSNAIAKGLISYFEVAEIVFELRCQDSHFENQAPNEIVELGTKLLSGEIKTVYCPFTASHRFAEKLSLQGQEVYLELSNPSDTAWTRMSAELKDAKYNQEFLPSHPVRSPIYIGEKGLKQFSHTIAMAPFGGKYPKDINDIFGRFPEKSLMGEVLQLRHMLAQTSNQVVTFVYNAFLARTTAGEKQFKQSVTKQGWLKAVIALPPKLLNNTQIAISALVFNKAAPVDKVLFINASGDNFSKKNGKVTSLDNVDDIVYLFNNPALESELSIEVPISEIEANDFNLLPSRYVLSQEKTRLNSFLASHKTHSLVDIAELITPQAIKDEMSGEHVFSEFGLTHMNSIGELASHGKQIATSSQISQVRKQVLRPGDILIVSKGSIGKVALVGDDLCDNAIASQAFTIVRISKHFSKITPTALFQYLLSPMGQLQLSTLSRGETVSMIGTKDLKSMPIPEFTDKQILEAEKTRTSVKDFYIELSDIKQKIDELNQSNWIS